MKKILFACMISAAMIAPAHAAGPYFGLGVIAFDKDYSSGSDIEGRFKFSGGYDFTDTWGVEGGLLGLPRYNNYNADGSWIDKDRGHIMYMAGKATMPINEKFSLISKLGIAQTRVKYSDGGHDSTTGLYAGIGLKYALTEKVAVTLELERMGRQPKNIVGSIRPESLSVNVHYKF